MSEDKKLKKSDTCDVCGAVCLYETQKTLKMCGFCREKAFVDGLEYSYTTQQAPRIKFNLPKSTMEKRKWLSEALHMPQADVDNLSISLLYDIFKLMPGKMDTTPQGVSELVARIRLSIIRSGIEVQNKKIQQLFNDELTEVHKTEAPAKGAPIVGPQTRFKIR